jgi:rhamnosyltransferase
MKLVGIIVAFNPHINQLLSNIERLILEVDQLLIYRNSKIEIETMLIDKFGDKLVFLGSEINIGIGEALNAGVYWAKNKNFTHILTLDQDSYFEVGHLLQFRQLIENSIELKNVGVYIPNFINRGVIYISEITTPFEVSDGITSGSIIPINLFNIVKGFNDFLFIDGVDSEFCFRIKKEHGMKTVMFPTIHLIHELGDFQKSVFGFYIVNYSAFRTFYLVRNHLLLWRKYPNFYSKKNKAIILRDFILYRIIKIILAEKDKIRKIGSIIRGIFHGLKYRL